MLVPIAFVVLVIAQLFDLLTFLAMVELHGFAAEANPIVVALGNQIGLVGLAVVKIGALVFAAATVAILVRRRPILATAVLAFGVGLGFFGGLTNMVTIFAT